ncbi:hypothetical protein GDO78_020156 [Eleutherodactylus coqui]|uniref:Uncharacterized protein n=1 Tax=Eleutherodactylus coqui TaxID=57060 RepID=A0A8J6E8W8_ELECQ|nr:hypothetical protein GDO78_020156 [Eleutherodactylus coqui]
MKDQSTRSNAFSASIPKNISGILFFLAYCMEWRSIEALSLPSLPFTKPVCSSDISLGMILLNRLAINLAQIFISTFNKEIGL